tara:strand:+ start:1218 stop:1637 length:420 start_codon:yes stop_codon:yes gene_type:complete
MAKVIIENNNIYKIATDTDISNFASTDLRTIMDLSDSDFNQVITNQKHLVLSDGALSLEDVEYSYVSAENLQIHIDNLIKTINIFLNANKENGMYDRLLAYKNFLTEFKTDTIEYPLTKSWEEYCNENSISFFHYLQIP